MIGVAVCRNRKWKYGGDRGIELDLYKVLVDPNTEYGPIGYPYDARKLLPVLAKPEVVMADVAQSSTGECRTLQAQKWLKTATGSHFRPNRK